MLTHNGPREREVARYTDHYFTRTRKAIGRFGDARVTYALFLRRPVCFAPRLMTEWLEAVAAERGTEFTIDCQFEEGEWVGAGEPLVYLSGSFRHLVDLETLYLQRLGACCVAAYNAYAMARTLPRVGFLAMDARHCAGLEMAEMMAYAASVGSTAAKQECGAVGFIGNATDATAHYFGNQGGYGTMPHAFIGYAGSTLRAAEMYHEIFEGEPMTVLVDYYGQEITDTLAVCRRFPELAARGELSIRLDTHGSRYVEGPGHGGILRRARALQPQCGARIPHRGRAALAERHGRERSRALPLARGARRCGLREGEDRREFRLQPRQVQGHGQRERADRRNRHRLVPARELVRDICDGGYHRLRRHGAGQARPRVPVAQWRRRLIR